MPLSRRVFRRQPLLQPLQHAGDKEDSVRLQGSQDQGAEPGCQ